MPPLEGPRSKGAKRVVDRSEERHRAFASYLGSKGGAVPSRSVRVKLMES
jgi:hypothetical protein